MQHDGARSLTRLASRALCQAHARAKLGLAWLGKGWACRVQEVKSSQGLARRRDASALLRCRERRAGPRRPNSHQRLVPRGAARSDAPLPSHVGRAARSVQAAQAMLGCATPQRDQIRWCSQVRGARPLGRGVLPRPLRRALVPHRWPTTRAAHEGQRAHAQTTKVHGASARPAGIRRQLSGLLRRRDGQSSWSAHGVRAGQPERAIGRGAPLQPVQEPGVASVRGAGPIARPGRPRHCLFGRAQFAADAAGLAAADTECTAIVPMATACSTSSSSRAVIAAAAAAAAAAAFVASASASAHVWRLRRPTPQRLPRLQLHQ